MVVIDGADMDKEFLSARVMSVVAEESARGLSRATVLVQNENVAFTDHELLQGNSLGVQIWTGYAGQRLVKRGSYLATVPRFAFRNRAMPVIELNCYGQEWPLMISEEREVYENLTDAQIASLIARKHDLVPDVESTSPLYEHVAQFNMTDMEFLENRALLYGYDVYVEEGVLHFHRPRFVHSGLNLFYRRGEAGLLTSFEVVVDPWVNGAEWTKSGINRITGNPWEFRDGGDSDAVSAELKDRAGPGFQSAADLAEVNGTRPRRFIVGEGHEMTEGEGRQQVRGFGRATEWLVTGSAEVLGIESLKARTVVTISGLGHLSGDYYVTQVVHSITPDNPYTMSFKVMRPGVGRLRDLARSVARSPVTRRDRRDATSESLSAGNVSVG